LTDLPLPQAFIARNVVSLFQDPASSEIVSQVIMGAPVRIEEEADKYRRIYLEDRYRGWVAAEDLVPAWDQTDYLVTSIATLFADVFAAPDPHSEILTKLTVSARVCVAHRPECDHFVPVILPNREVGYIHDVCLNMTHGAAQDQADLIDLKTRKALDLEGLKRQIMQAVGQQAAKTAQRFVGTPYLWGGCTPFGLDCSGFVQLSYKLSGIQLLRDAYQQYADKRFQRVDGGQGLDEQEWAAGDLLVFSGRKDLRPTHIGIALGDGRFIHALSGQGVCLHPCTTPRFCDLFAGAIRISPDADLSIDAA
jgi:hypothetical protein